MHETSPLSPTTVVMSTIDTRSFRERMRRTWPIHVCLKRDCFAITHLHLTRYWAAPQLPSAWKPSAAEGEPLLAPSLRCFPISCRRLGGEARPVRAWLMATATGSKCGSDLNSTTSIFYGCACFHSTIRAPLPPMGCLPFWQTSPSAGLCYVGNI